MKRKNKLIVLSSILTSLVLVGGVSYGVVNQKFEDYSNGGLVVETMNKGIAVKKLNTVENEDGTVTQTFTYSINSSATDQRITYSLSGASSKFRVVIDEDSKTISVTCYGDFNTPSTLTLSSVSNPDVTAVITLDYEKKLKSISAGYNYNHSNGVYHWGGTSNSLSGLSIKDTLSDSYFYEAYFSYYTIDKNYTFSSSAYSFEFDKDTTGLDIYNKYLNEDLMLNFFNSYSHGKYLSPSYLFNLTDNVNYKNDLKNIVTGSGVYISGTFTYKVTCNETGDVFENDVYIYLGLDKDYTGYTFYPNDIEFEDTSIEF